MVGRIPGPPSRAVAGRLERREEVADDRLGVELLPVGDRLAALGALDEGAVEDFH